MAMIKVGPTRAGGKEKDGTSLWDEKGRGELAQIFVSYSPNKVNALQFMSYENGKLVLSDRRGGGHCNNFKAIVFDYPSEFLTSISGSFGLAYGYSYLRSISFFTNKGCYGSFGSTNTSGDGMSEFNFQIGNYPSFCGFHGSTNCHGIDSIGVYVKPITTSIIHSKDCLAKVKKEEDQEKV